MGTQCWTKMVSDNVERKHKKHGLIKVVRQQKRGLTLFIFSRVLVENSLDKGIEINRPYRRYVSLPLSDIYLTNR